MEKDSVSFLLMRGGTSKGVFLERAEVPTDRSALVPLLLDIFGSPDVRQINGLGGADKLTSKAGIMGAPTRADADIDYLFAQVGITHAEVDFNLNCGNLTAAAAAYAVHQGYVLPVEGETAVRVHNVNTGRVVHARVPVRLGRVQEHGVYVLDGVPGSGAPISLDFREAVGAITQKLLPLGEPITSLAIPGHGSLNVSVVDGPNLIVLVSAADLGMEGTETPEEIDRNRTLTHLMQNIRQSVAEAVGLGEYWHNRAAPSTPMLIALQSPRTYRRYTTGVPVQAHDTDLLVRQYSTSATSKALAATVASAIGMACRIPNTLANRFLRESAHIAQTIRLGHPSGVISVNAGRFQGTDETAPFERMEIIRTARRIARGEVYLSQKQE